MVRVGVCTDHPAKLKDTQDKIEEYLKKRSCWYEMEAFLGIKELLAALEGEKLDILFLEMISEKQAKAAVMLGQKEKDMMDPFVVVKGGSRVWESSCGSGTCAIGSFLAKEAGGKASVSLQEPGGELGAEAFWDGEKIQSLRLMGHVKILEESTYSFEES